MAIRLVVFDLDGTLIDSRRDLADATNALIAGLGGEPLSLEAVTAMVGEGAAVLVRRALTAAGLDPSAPGALERFLAHYDDRLTVHTRPYDGIVASLEALRSDGLALAVLTNKPGRPTREILERLELARFLFAGHWRRQPARTQARSGGITQPRGTGRASRRLPPCWWATRRST